MRCQTLDVMQTLVQCGWQPWRCSCPCCNQQCSVRGRVRLSVFSTPSTGKRVRCAVSRLRRERTGGGQWAVLLGQFIFITFTCTVPDASDIALNFVKLRPLALLSSKVCPWPFCHLSSPVTQLSGPASPQSPWIWSACVTRYQS